MSKEMYVMLFGSYEYRVLNGVLQEAFNNNNKQLSDDDWYDFKAEGILPMKERLALALVEKYENILQQQKAENEELRAKDFHNNKFSHKHFREKAEQENTQLKQQLEKLKQSEQVCELCKTDEIHQDYAKLKQQIEVAEKALKELNNIPCPLDDINISFLDTTLKPCEICSIKNNYKCIGSVITQALTQMQKVEE